MVGQCRRRLRGYELNSTLELLRTDVSGGHRHDTWAANARGLRHRRRGIESRANPEGVVGAWGWMWGGRLATETNTAFTGNGML